MNSSYTKLSEADEFWANEACTYYENKMAELNKPMSEEAKKFFREGYREAVLDKNFVIINLLDEDFTKEGFEREQFSEEALKGIINALTNLYPNSRQTLKRDLARELIRNEAANLKLKPKF